jgi:hypothetical protein
MEFTSNKGYVIYHLIFEKWFKDRNGADVSEWVDSINEADVYFNLDQLDHGMLTMLTVKCTTLFEIQHGNTLMIFELSGGFDYAKDKWNMAVDFSSGFPLKDIFISVYTD